MGMLLLEGRVVGHMNHLYDNPDLTFAQMKDIFQKAIGGQLVGTEKTDGQNLFLSYSVAERKAKAARNKGDIKSGGMTGEALASKFSGRGALEKAFVESFQSWEEVVSKFPPKEQVMMFGKDADIWYNAEVQDPGTANVVNYDTRNLVLHKAGHAMFDKKIGSVTNVGVSENYSILSQSIERIQKADVKTKFKVINNADRELRALHDKKPLKIAFAKLDKLLSTAGVTDNETIGHYISARLSSYISKQIPDLKPKAKENLIGKIIGTKGLNINKIIENLPEDQQHKVKIIANNAEGVLKQIIGPLEDIVHDYSVELLKGLESIFILDNKKEVQRLKQEVAQVIQNIQNSGHEDAIKILDKQLHKLKNAENVSTAVEGFVFVYDGVIYKLTGNFAPINQILGLFRYGRGKIPPLRDIVKESAKNKIIGLMPGGFKPPHIGHYLSAKYLADIPNVDEVRVIISPKSREDDTGGVIIDATKSLKIWKIYIKGNPKIHAQISKVSSPVKDVYDFMETMNPGDTLLVAMGEKDVGDTRFKRAQEWSDQKKLGVKVQPIETKVPEKLMNVSASGLRKLIAEGNKTEFVKYLPTHLSDKEKAEVWNIVSNKKTTEEGRVKYKPEVALDKAYELVLRHLPHLKREEFDNLKFPHNMFGTVTPKFFAWQKAEPPEKIAQLVLQQVQKTVKELVNEHIVKSGDKYCLYSKKSNKNLGCYPSRGGAENREKQVQYFKHANEGMDGHRGPCEGTHPQTTHEQWLESLQEMSAMAGGAVQGGAVGPGMKSPWKNKEMHGDLTVNRHAFYEELREEKLAREFIREIIQECRESKNYEVRSTLLEETRLRSLIRQSLLKEAKDDDKVPHDSTGINVLEELLKKIIPIIEEDYKSLTTSETQRQSFRSHILNAVQKTLTTADININAGKDDEALMEEVSVKVDEPSTDDNDPNGNEKFIDIDKKKGQDKGDTFGIEGEDVTGRNMAEKCFDKVGKNMVDSYSLLGDPEDKKLFYDYLITNLKLYFDKFESELGSTVKEPEVNAEEPEETELDEPEV